MKRNNILEKGLVRLLLVFACLLSFSQSYGAIWFYVDGFTYTVVSEEDRTVEFSRDTYNEYGSTLEIPSKVEYSGFEFTVISIGKDAFNNQLSQRRLKEITLPESIEEIGENAFSQCEVLEKVTLNEGLKRIGSHAFNGCRSLSTIDLPSSLVEVGEWVMSDCKSLETISWPEKIKEIPNCFFSGCSQLKEVNFSGDVEVIGDWAFNGCLSLKEFRFPASLRTIGSKAFAGCPFENVILNDSLQTIENGVFEYNRSLKTFYIPASVESIGDGVFLYCSPSLTFTVDPDSPYFMAEGNALYSKDKTELYVYPFDGDTAIIPEGVKRIKGYIYYYNLDLVTIILPPSIEYIGTFACGECRNLKTVVCKPINTPAIGAYPFNDSGMCLYLGCDIYVPYESLQEYKDTWKSWASYIFPIEDAGVEEVGMVPQADSYTVYTVDGRCVMHTSNPDALQDLDKGLYIINGKKVMLK